MKTFLVALALVFWTLPVSAQTDPEFAADYKVADQVLKALQADDRRAVAALVTYPLSRTAPLKPIRNSKEFLSHWDEFFDADTIKTLLAEKPDQYGWRGVALAGGRVWFAKGHIIAIYTDTAASKQVLADAKAQEGGKLYPSARGYTKMMFQCATPTLNVRAQFHDKDLRYFAWKKGVPFSAKPALEMRGGVYDPQGTGGNFNLNFANKGYTYQLSVGHNLCGEDCKDYLDVMQGQKTISHQVCTETKP